MSIGNIWLGSVVGHTIAASGDLTVNSFNMSTTSLSTPGVLAYVSANVSGNMANTMNVTYTPAAGSSYAHVLVRKSMSGLSSYFYRPCPPLFIFPGDSVTLNVSNATATGGIYGSITLLY